MHRLLLALATVSPNVLDQNPGAELTLDVSGIESSGGEIGCALFARADGFPLEAAQARQMVWVPAKAPRTECVFRQEAPGR